MLADYKTPLSAQVHFVTGGAAGQVRGTGEQCDTKIRRGVGGGDRPGVLFWFTSQVSSILLKTENNVGFRRGLFVRLNCP